MEPVAPCSRSVVFSAARGRILRLQLERAAHVRGRRGLLVGLQVEPGQDQVSGHVRLHFERLVGLRARFLGVALALPHQRQPGMGVSVTALGYRALPETRAPPPESDPG